MTQFTKSVIAGLLLVTILAGCIMTPRGSGAHVTYYGSFNESNNFHMGGYLSSGGGIPDKDAFRSVSIQLYSEDGTLLCTSEVGRLIANQGRTNISISVTTVPHYILILSPDFWDEQTEVDYFRRNEDEGTYTAIGVTSRESLPVEVENNRSKPC